MTGEATIEQRPIRARGRDVDRQLAQRPVEPSDAGVSDKVAIEHLHDELRDVQGRLTAADAACTADRARFADLIQQHDQARSKLQCEHRRIHRVISGRFRIHDLALSRPALDLVRTVCLTIDLLRQLDTVAPPTAEGPFDAPAMAADLEDDVRELEAAASGLDAGRAAAVASRSHLEAVIAEADRVLLRSGRCLARLGQLAEEHRLS